MIGLGMKKRDFLLSIILTTLAVLCIVVPASAQYQLYGWANFDNGKIPETSQPFGQFFSQGVSVVDYGNVRGMPPQFNTGVFSAQVGKHGLQLRGDPNIYIVGLADGVILDRDRLGTTGRALYQADFFVPEPGKPMPSLAVLAMVPIRPGFTEPDVFYRFGMAHNKYLYFSVVARDEATARVYLHDPEMMTKLPRPAWHRFAIVFEGADNIRCYVDGREPKFSPIKEPTMRRLQVGIMLAEKESTYLCYADNLSIQWTPENAPIPVSPYTFTWGGAAPPTPVAPAVAPVPGGVKIEWKDTATAWNTAISSGKPMFVYFSAPNVLAVNKLDQLFASDAQAQTFIQGYIPTKIDVNQLAGGDLARKFQIFKVPTILLMDSKGHETGRAIFSMADNWDTFTKKLIK